jgi:hypothetical protein
MEIILNKTKELMSLYENMIDEDDIVEYKKLQTIMDCINSLIPLFYLK